MFMSRFPPAIIPHTNHDRFSITYNIAPYTLCMYLHGSCDRRRAGVEARTGDAAVEREHVLGRGLEVAAETSSHESSSSTEYSKSGGHAGLEPILDR